MAVFDFDILWFCKIGGKNGGLEEGNVGSRKLGPHFIENVRKNLLQSVVLRYGKGEAYLKQQDKSNFGQVVIGTFRLKTK